MEARKRKATLDTYKQQKRRSNHKGHDTPGNKIYKELPESRAEENLDRAITFHKEDTMICEDQLSCSVCIDVFTDPVTTPCGHSFCRECITHFWDHKEVFLCPLCKSEFPERPTLNRNIVLAEISEKMQSVIGQHTSVTCDICTVGKQKAIKSCLECLTSYCSRHLKEHFKDVNHWMHSLDDPDTFMTQLADSQVEIQKNINKRKIKIHDLKQQMKSIRKVAHNEKEESEKILDRLIQHIEKTKAEMNRLMKEKQKSKLQWAKASVRQTEEDITRLEHRSRRLQNLLSKVDCAAEQEPPLDVSAAPEDEGLPADDTAPNFHLSVFSKEFSVMAEHLRMELDEVIEGELDRMRRYAADVVLDSNTAHPWIVVSEDGKVLRNGGHCQSALKKPMAFENGPNVLGKEGFATGRHYWEVEVGNKTEWYLGVARESVDRKRRTSLCPEAGYWVICLKDGNDFQALTWPSMSLPRRLKAQKIGLFLDYDQGQVSFYNVEGKSHIFTFSDVFTEKVYPFFGTASYQNGKNAGPMAICRLNASY
ncbi:E3 ubiquitin-protein ligase TRIM39-like isoform X1 [Erpetoichthys calabaricus]|uniref:E3 ubiquitin-protein ligase TRIM39-like isoform X1 n=1 Tax=Erpetoichthys calabaricus TaxID=27687 RepID=UPI002234C6B5|nr:E3 ubiquitin-protein ligase TRIM39-like isoform X1 [Erpetoichthys calabaricus]